MSFSLMYTWALQVNFIAIVSVMELHQNSSVQEPQKKLKRKFDHMVLGPAAGQGLSNRLQCQGS